jgi:hypothetical protein
MEDGKVAWLGVIARPCSCSPLANTLKLLDNRRAAPAKRQITKTVICVPRRSSCRRQKLRRWHVPSVSMPG